MDQEIRYCATQDGVRIAFATSGSGPPLVVPRGYPTAIEMEPSLPQALGFYATLGHSHSVVRYDQRGIGASERDVGEISLDSLLLDLEAVTDHLRLTSFDLFGAMIGADVGVLFAARHPGRIRRLVLWEPLGPLRHDPNRETRKAIEQLIRTNWTLATQTMANIVFPNGPPELQQWVTQSYRSTVAPETMIKYLRIDSTAVVEHYGSLAMPTLVMHVTRDPQIPIEGSRAAAAVIPNARFVAIEGETPMALVYPDVPGMIAKFLDEPASNGPLDEVRAAGGVRSLTARELDVLRLIATGRTNSEIAVQLTLSVRTVARHITNIYAKIDARGRADATAFALRNHLV